MSSENRDPSPTPSERERQDAADRTREQEEQAKLPYKWTQTLTEADITIPIAGNLKSRDVIVELKKTHLKVSIKGQEPFIDGDTPHPILIDDSTWTLETTKAGKDLSIHLQKSPGSNWWAHIVTICMVVWLVLPVLAFGRRRPAFPARRAWERGRDFRRTW